MAVRETHAYQPVTEADLNEWEARARASRSRNREFMLRLIAEVRRLRSELAGASADSTTGGAAKAGNQAQPPGLTSPHAVDSALVPIVRDPEVCGGAPTFAGTRIGVHDVVAYAQVYGGDLTRVREEALPDLSMDQIRGAMDWYHEHQHEIDDILRRRREFYERGLAASQRRG